MMANLTLPNLEGMLPHQIKLLRDQHRFKTLVWHRRSRKTTTALEKLVLECHNPKYPNKVYWHIFPTYGEAKDAVWTDPSMLFRIIPQELIEKTNESELTVYFKSGSILMLKGADKPERLLGSGPFGVVLDEFAEMKFETWTRIVQPILRANNGWCWFVGTPKGKNHLYRTYLKGVEDNPEWKSWLLKASQSNILSQEQLEAAKYDMPANLFNQEFECDFLEGEGSVFRNVKAITTAVPREPLEKHLYVIGVDLARVRDYTVLSVYDRATNEQVYQDRFNTIEWGFQKKRIKAISDHYNHSLVILDATGVGDPVADDLIRAGVPIEPFKITEPSKKELIEKLSIWIEQKSIKVLPIEETVNELESFSYEIGSTGRIRYGAPEGLHDDIVISHALAVSSLSPLYTQVQVAPKQPSRVQQARQRANRALDDNSISQSEWDEWSAI